jgi:hypothetical protein
MSLDIDDVVTAVLEHVETLGLALEEGGPALPVIAAKQAHFEEGRDPTAQLTVCPATVRPHETTHHTNLHVRHTFRIRISIWIPGNLDPARVAETAGSGSKGHAVIESALRDAFDEKPEGLMGLDGLRDVSAETSSYLDRPGYVKGWDVQSITVTVEIVRQR